MQMHYNKTHTWRKWDFWIRKILRLCCINTSTNWLSWWVHFQPFLEKNWWGRWRISQFECQWEIRRMAREIENVDIGIRLGRPASFDQKLQPSILGICLLFTSENSLPLATKNKPALLLGGTTHCCSCNCLKRLIPENLQPWCKAEPVAITTVQKTVSEERCSLFIWNYHKSKN